MPQEIIKNWVSSQENLSAHEQLRVTQQIKAELNNLQSEVTNSITAEKFYEIKDGTVHYHMDLVKQYLRTIKDKEWKDLKAENSSAWIMAVQIGLESLWKEEYDVGRIDGILRSKNQTESHTMKAIKKFQKDHGLTEDGYPGKETIKELLKVLNGEEIINDHWLTNPVEEVVNDQVVEQQGQEQPQIQEQVPENLERDETKAKKAIEELNNNNKRLHQEKEYLQNLQWPYTNKNNVTIIPQNLDSYQSTVDARYFRKDTILDISTFIKLAETNNRNIKGHLNYLTSNWCTITNGKVTRNGKEIWTIPTVMATFDEKDYDFNLLWKTLIKDYNEYQTEFWADSAKQQAKLEELLGILGMSLDKSTWKITDKKAQEVGTITPIHQEGVDNIPEQEKKLSEAVKAVEDNIKNVDKIIDDNIAILQDSTKTEEDKMQAIQTIINHNNFNYVKKITSWLPKEVSWAINNNYRRWIQGSTPAPLQLSLSCGDKHAKLPEIPYKGEQWDKVGKYLIENFTNKNKAKQFKTEEEFKKAETQCIDMLKKFNISSKSILNGLSFEISNQKGEKIWSLPWLWNNPNTPVITYESENGDIDIIQELDVNTTSLWECITYKNITTVEQAKKLAQYVKNNEKIQLLKLQQEEIEKPEIAQALLSCDKRLVIDCSNNSKINPNILSELAKHSKELMIDWGSDSQRNTEQIQALSKYTWEHLNIVGKIQKEDLSLLQDIPNQLSLPLLDYNQVDYTIFPNFKCKILELNNITNLKKSDIQHIKQYIDKWWTFKTRTNNQDTQTWEYKFSPLWDELRAEFWEYDTELQYPLNTNNSLWQGITIKKK